MQFDRDELEEEVLEKVKEVNEEAGYRPYFELPEYVHIVASIMEEKFRVEYDDLVNQIHLLSKELDKAQIKAENLEEENKRLKALLYETIEYIVCEKGLRNRHEGPDARLDRDADALVHEISKQFTENELEEAKKTYYQKYQ